MTHQTKVGLAVLATSLSTLIGGVLLVRRAHAMPVPVEAATADFLLMMGWMLVGCGAFGLLLAAGLIFWVDRSGEQPPT